MIFKRPESVLVVLYNEHNHVLVMQRLDDPKFWQSVTGSMEDGETAIQTAVREVFEETGIQLSIEKPSQAEVLYHVVDCQKTNQYNIRDEWRYRYAPHVNVNVEHVFSAKVAASKHIKLTEHASYLWLNKTQAMEKVWSNTNKDAIKRFVPAVLE